MTLSSLRGKSLTWGLTGVLLIACGTVATVWLMRDNSKTTAAGGDCAVVKRLAAEWVTMSESVRAAVESGPGERSDLLAAANRESAMSEKLHAAANSFSSPAFKDHFVKWAEGAALTAQIQRDSVNRPFQVVLPPDLQAKMRHAALLTDEASGALLQACPDAHPASTQH